MNKKDKWNSEYYTEHSDPQEQSALSVLDKIKFKGNESILDIGCGDGRTTAEIASRVPEGSIIGIDQSANMVNAATKTYKNIRNLSFRKADAVNFKPEQQFDIIISFFALHWIADQEKLFKNIKKFIKAY